MLKCEVCGVSEKDEPLYGFYGDVSTCKNCTPPPKEAVAIILDRCAPSVREQVKCMTDAEIEADVQRWRDLHIHKKGPRG